MKKVSVIFNILLFVFIFSVFYEKIYDWHIKYVDNAQILFMIYLVIANFVSILGMLFSMFIDTKKLIPEMQKNKDLKNSQKLHNQIFSVSLNVLYWVCTIGLAVVGAWGVFTCVLMTAIVNTWSILFIKKCYKIYSELIEAEKKTGSFKASYEIVGGQR